MTVPLWAWMLLFVAALLAVGWFADRRRRLTHDLERPARSENLKALTPREARRDANAHYHGGMGFWSGRD